MGSSSARRLDWFHSFSFIHLTRFSLLKKGGQSCYQFYERMPDVREVWERGELVDVVASNGKEWVLVASVEESRWSKDCHFHHSLHFPSDWLTQFVWAKKAEVSVFQLKFSSQNILHCFQDGTELDKVIEMLNKKEISVGELPMLRVCFWRDTFCSLDNSLLYCLQQHFLSSLPPNSYTAPPLLPSSLSSFSPPPTPLQQEQVGVEGEESGVEGEEWRGVVPVILSHFSSSSPPPSFSSNFDGSPSSLLLYCKAQNCPCNKKDFSLSPPSSPSPFSSFLPPFHAKLDEREEVSVKVGKKKEKRKEFQVQNEEKVRKEVKSSLGEVKSSLEEVKSSLGENKSLFNYNINHRPSTKRTLSSLSLLSSPNSTPSQPLEEKKREREERKRELQNERRRKQAESKIEKNSKPSLCEESDNKERNNNASNDLVEINNNASNVKKNGRDDCKKKSPKAKKLLTSSNLVLGEEKGRRKSLISVKDLVSENSDSSSSQEKEVTRSNGNRKAFVLEKNSFKKERKGKKLNDNKKKEKKKERN